MSYRNLRSLNLVDMLHQRAGKSPDELAFSFLEDGEEKEDDITFLELDRHAQIIAANLQERGASGERILLLFPPGLDYIRAFFGCLYASALAVPTYPPDVTRLERTMPRFLSIIEDSQPKFVLTTSPILMMAQILVAQNPVLQTMQWLSIDEMLLSDQSSESSWRYPDISGDTLAFLQYTSGSTALPKGVMLSHNNLLDNLQAICAAFDVEDNDEAVFWLPFYHDMGLIGGILAPVYCGVHNTLMSPLDFLQRPLRWLRAITRKQATISGGPNFAYDLCIRKIKAEQKQLLDLSSWSLAFNGAEPVRPDTMERFTQSFAECGFRHQAFYPCYGLAEGTVFVTGINRPDPPLVLLFDAEGLANGEARAVTPTSGVPEIQTRELVGCGYTRMGHEVWIIDPDTLDPVPISEDGNSTKIGEIWVHGGSVAKGYWGRQEESERIFRGQPNSMDKQFLRTGDMGFLYRGELFITGRLKDLIIIDGLNHYPQDIELSVERSHPALRPGCSAAFSVDIDDRERLVVVAEVARPKKLLELQESIVMGMERQDILGSIRKAISNQHELNVYDIVLLAPGSVPKTSSGKIQRHACKAGYLDGSLERWNG